MQMRAGEGRPRAALRLRGPGGGREILALEMFLPRSTHDRKIGCDLAYQDHSLLLVSIITRPKKHWLPVSGGSLYFESRKGPDPRIG